MPDDLDKFVAEHPAVRRTADTGGSGGPSVDDELDEFVVSSAAKRTGASGEWAEPTPEDPKSVMGFLGNIPSSAFKLAEGIGTMVLHPVDTVRAVGDVALGGVQKLRHTVRPDSTLNPSSGSVMEQEDPTLNKSPVFDAFLHSLKERYGGASAISNTLYEDPVGSAMDVAGLLSGGATATASRLPAVSKFLRAASEVVDPLRAAGKVAGATGKGIANVAKQYEGVATGTGPEVVSIAAHADLHPDFKPFMRGGGTHREVLDTVQHAVNQLMDRRRDTYQAQLAQIPKQFVLDPAPIRQAMADALQRFNIRVVAGKKGQTLDFSRSALRNVPGEVSKVNAMFEDMLDWGTRPDDLTPLGLDRLKQGLNEMVNAAPGRGDVIVKSVSDKTRELLEQQVPGYREMTSDYAKASQFLDEVRAELSVGPNAKEGAGIRKLSNALNQKPSYRSDLIDTLDITFGTDIKGQIAGLEMQSYLPRGIVGRIAVGGVGAAHLGKLGTLMSNPGELVAALAGAATFSPRLVGETLAAIANFKRLQAVEMMGASASAARRVVFDPKTLRLVQESVKAKKSEEDRAKTETEMRNWLIGRPPGVEP